MRRASAGGGGGVLADEAFHGVGAEAPPGAGREQRLVAEPGSFGQPDAQHREGGCGERDRSLSAAFALAADVGTGAEGDVAAVEPGQLGDPQPGLHGQQQQRAVAASLPPVRSGAASRASISAGVRNDTVGLSNRLAGWRAPAG